MAVFFQHAEYVYDRINSKRTKELKVWLTDLQGDMDQLNDKQYLSIRAI
jgi:hypothetical protein